MNEDEEVKLAMELEMIEKEARKGEDITREKDMEDYNDIVQECKKSREGED